MNNDYRFEDSTYYLRLFFAEIMPGHTGAASSRRKRESEASLELTAKAFAFYLGSKPSPEVLAGLKRTPDGKPYFPDYPDFHYNISHSGRYAVCGMICGGTKMQPVGIDSRSADIDSRSAGVKAQPVGIDLQEIPSDCGQLLLGVGEKVSPFTCGPRRRFSRSSSLLPLLDCQRELYKTDRTRVGSAIRQL